MAAQQEIVKPEVIDAPLLKVPFESLKRAAKERKALVDEAGEAFSSLSSPGSQDEQLQQIDQLVSRLQGLKRKLTDVTQQEEGDAMRVKARLDHLQQLGAPGKGSVVVWNKQRLDRLLVDHMLRTGNQASAGEILHCPAENRNKASAFYCSEVCLCPNHTGLRSHYAAAARTNSTIRCQCCACTPVLLRHLTYLPSLLPLPCPTPSTPCQGDWLRRPVRSAHLCPGTACDPVPDAA